MKRINYDNILVKYTMISLIFSVILSFFLGYTFSIILQRYIIKTHVKFYPHIIEMHFAENYFNRHYLKKEKILDANLQKKLDDFIKNNNIIFIKIWDTNNNIIWSNIESMIGKNFKNDEYEEALEGKLEYEVKKKSNRAENINEIKNEKTFEFYIPIYSEKK